MENLRGKKISLRALEPEDLEFLYAVENNEANWEISNTQAPFSKYLLKRYLENAHLDIYEAKQLRLVIEHSVSKQAIGLIDLFDFNPQHKRVGVGILIAAEFQQNGFASDALALLVPYAFTHLGVHQLYANITSDNRKSIALFEKHRFREVGVKKDWILSNGKFKDELLFQLIK